MTLAAIREISRDAGTPFVPPIDSFEVLSERWEECEYRCFETSDGRSVGGIWEGQPGVLRLAPWPYDEVCMMLGGRVALVDDLGARREFGPGEAFFVPRTFSGTWETLKPSSKLFIALGRNGDVE